MFSTHSGTHNGGKASRTAIHRAADRMTERRPARDRRPTGLAATTNLTLPLPSRLTFQQNPSSISGERELLSPRVPPPGTPDVRHSAGWIQVARSLAEQRKRYGNEPGWCFAFRTRKAIYVPAPPGFARSGLQNRTRGNEARHRKRAALSCFFTGIDAAT